MKKKLNHSWMSVLIGTRDKLMGTVDLMAEAFLFIFVFQSFQSAIFVEDLDWENTSQLDVTATFLKVRMGK
jgi:hypothetical protein